MCMLAYVTSNCVMYAGAHGDYTEFKLIELSILAAASAVVVVAAIVATVILTAATKAVTTAEENENDDDDPRASATKTIHIDASFQMTIQEFKS